MTDAELKEILATFVCAPNGSQVDKKVLINAAGNSHNLAVVLVDKLYTHIFPTE